MIENNHRVPQANIDSLFLKRWSPRAFDKDFKISDEEVKNLMGAARWSPSSYNDQPWRFVFAKRDDKEFESFIDLLMDMNQTWAKNASAIGFIFAKRVSDKTGEENLVAEFDCGAAWMAMTLQARKDGLYTHGMGGIHRDKTYAALNIPKDDFKVICAFAIGKKASKDILPEDLKKKEKLSDRKEIDEILYHGKFENIH